MSLSIAEARSIFDAKKTLINIGEWIPQQKEAAPTSVYNFSARVRLNGSIPRGVWFRIVLRNVWQSTASLQLDCEQPHVRVHIPLYRLDWRPLRSHKNGAFGPPELQGVFFDKGVSHEHFCFDHAVESEGIIRSDGVQTARKIEPDFIDFQSALSHVCGILKIENADEIPLIDPQGALF